MFLFYPQPPKEGFSEWELLLFVIILHLKISLSSKSPLEDSGVKFSFIIL